MMILAVARAKRLAGGGPLERRVRQHAAAVPQKRTWHGGGVVHRRESQCTPLGATDGGEQRRVIRVVAALPKRQNELNHSGRSLRKASGIRSRVFAALAAQRRWGGKSGTRCCLTLELRGRSRRGALAARRMICLSASRPRRLAGGGPFERRVRLPRPGAEGPRGRRTEDTPARLGCGSHWCEETEQWRGYAGRCREPDLRKPRPLDAGAQVVQVA
jgi:hypothetical protein